MHILSKSFTVLSFWLIYLAVYFLTFWEFLKYRDICSADWRVRLLSIAIFASPPGERSQRTAVSCLFGSISALTDGQERGTPDRTQKINREHDGAPQPGKIKHKFILTGQINAQTGWVAAYAPGTARGSLSQSRRDKNDNSENKEVYVEQKHTNWFSRFS